MRRPQSLDYSTKGKARTRDTNPLYQGPYTYDDYLEDLKSRAMSEERAAFLQRFQFEAIPSEERERMDAIEKAARDLYDGPTEWATGTLWPSREVRTSMRALAYYSRYYEATDEEAVAMRLEEIREFAADMEARNTRYLAIKKAANDSPRFLGSVEAWAVQYEKTMLRRFQDGEALEWCIRDIVDGRPPSKETPEETVDREADRLEEEARGIEARTKDAYEDVMAGPNAEIMHAIERALPVEDFERMYGRFREEYPEEGYEDAVTRIYRNISSLRLLDKALGFSEEEGIPASKLDTVVSTVVSLASMEIVDEGVGARTSAAFDRIAEDERLSEFDMGKLYPSRTPKYYLSSHDHFNRLTAAEMLEHYDPEKGAWSHSLTYKRKTMKEEALEYGIIIDTMDGGKVLTDDDKAVMQVIASMIAEQDPDSYKGGMWETTKPIVLSENDIIRISNAQPGKEVRQEDKDDLKRLRNMGNAWTVIDYGAVIEKQPWVMDNLKKALPGWTPPKGKKDTGRRKLQLMPHTALTTVNTNPTKIVNEDGTVEEERQETVWYRFTQYPMSACWGTPIGQRSEVNMDVWLTPKIWENELREGSKEPRIRPEVIQACERMEASQVKILKKKGGVRYLQLTRVPRRMRSILLTELEYKFANQKYLEEQLHGVVCVDLDEMHARIWPDSEDSSAKRDHKRYMITFILYYMNENPERVADMRLEGKGRSPAHMV